MEIDLRKKNLLSWQNVLNSRQIAGDLEEKLANSLADSFVQQLVLFTVPYQTNRNHATEP